jgi:phosphate uptake regulator
MLKQLLTILSKGNQLDEAFRLSHQMLDITQDMFLSAKRLLREPEIDRPEPSVHSLDEKINKFECKVRRNVLQHLTVSGQEGLASGMKLVSIIGDIERVGDCTKNIVELAENHCGCLHGGESEADLKRVEESIEEAFVRVRSLLVTGSENEARAFIEDTIWLNPLCDQRVSQFVMEADP